MHLTKFLHALQNGQVVFYLNHLRFYLYYLPASLSIPKHFTHFLEVV